MATYEVLLFATLMVRRLGASHLIVRALLAAGIIVYAGASKGTGLRFIGIQPSSA